MGKKCANQKDSWTKNTWLKAGCLFPNGWPWVLMESAVIAQVVDERQSSAGLSEKSIEALGKVSL